MIGIIVCGHGHFASGITTGVELIAGKQDNYRAVDFNGNDDLANLLQAAVNQLAAEKLLIFTDILGGTPFRQASLIAAKHRCCEVIVGVTTQMLIEACLSRDDYDNLDTAVTELIESAREGITSLGRQMREQKNIPQSSDGI